MQQEYERKYAKYKTKYVQLRQSFNLSGGSSIKQCSVNPQNNTACVSMGRHFSLQQGGGGLTKEERTNEKPPKPEIYLFKAEWCGHCKNFKPVWEKLQKEYGKKYDFKTFDSDKNKEEIKQWNIQGFPTIIKRVKDNAVEYSGPREENSLLKFFEEAV